MVLLIGVEVVEGEVVLAKMMEGADNERIEEGKR